MSNAGKILIQRLAGSSLLCAKWPSPAQSLRGLRQQICRSHQPVAVSGLSNASHLFRYRVRDRSWSHVAARSFHQSAIFQALRPRKTDAKEEKGLAFNQRDLSLEDLQQVFGDETPPVRQANLLLRVIHGRRNDGTLDLPLSPNMQALLNIYPRAFDHGLAWLRENYYVDEDEAILARLEREEAGQFYSPSALKQQGQDAGLYHPQSGNYQAELSDSGREGDVWGKSQLERIRAENEAKAAEEEERLQQQIDDIMARKQIEQENKNKSLAARPEQGVQIAEELRPPNEFDKWVLRAKNAGQSKITLKDAEAMSFARRVFPSAVFVALIVAGCYLFAQYWTPPRRADRMNPDISLTYSTILAIAGINLVVFFAWRFPPAWGLLNKYFAMTPGYPRVLSLLGCTFSHQGGWHFLNNMLGLMILGSSLHEDVGRGTFLAIWIASGVCGSLASLVFHAARRSFATSVLGASGSVCGTLAALTWLNAE
jgi:rhomboid-like protein